MEWSKHIREMRESPIFWQLYSRGAYINGEVLHLCRVYDSHEKPSICLDSWRMSRGVSAYFAKANSEGVTRQIRTLNGWRNIRARSLSRAFKMIFIFAAKAIRYSQIFGTGGTTLWPISTIKRR